MRFLPAASLPPSRRALVFALALMAPTFATASGSLDTRFGGDGLATHDIGGDWVDRLFAGLIDSQGRLVGAGGQYSADSRRGGIVVRLTSTGALDPGFGNAGVARTPIPVASFDNLSWSGIVEDPDGRLLAAGRYSSNAQDQASHAYVCRFLSNGAPDPSFGTAGCTSPTIWPDSSQDTVEAIALQADGKLVLVGQTDYDHQAPPEYYVARLQVDGAIDRCLGDVSCQFGGVLIEPETSPELNDFAPRAVALAPDGRIVIAGKASVVQSVDMSAVRLLPTGAVDLDFGDGGHRHVAFDQGGFDIDVAEAVVVGPQGQVYLVGAVQTQLGQLAGAAALDANGDLDLGYGDAGRRLFYFNDVSIDQVAQGAQLQPDGKLVVTGYAADDGPYGDCGVARLDAGGDLDPVFGIGGTLNLDGNLGAEPMPLDGCSAVAVRFGTIALFGTSGPTLQTHDSLFVKLDQDGVFRDGYEDLP